VSAVAAPLRLFRALRHRRFALLWIGQTLSRLGDFTYEIALAWWVLAKTGSAATMSLVLIFAITPSVVFALIGGVAGDRFSRVGLMLASDGARGLVVAVVAVLAFADRLEVWHVFVASLVFGLVDAFFQPAYAGLVPQLVPADDLPSANSLTSLSVNLGRIGGPALGALIVAAYGSPAAFALNGASFFLSAAFLVPLAFALIPRPARAEAGSHWLDDLRQGLATVRASPVLWISIALFALTNITLAGPYSVAMPFLVSDNLHAGVNTLGLLYAVFPIGYVLGGIWQGHQPRLRRRGRWMYAATAVAAVLLGLFGFLLPVPVLLGAALVNGFALEVAHLAWVNVLQEKVPNEQMGRVSSIDNMGSFGLLPVGFALAGWATEAFGAPLVFIVGGAFTALLSLAALAHPAIRQLD
jgi:MFS family permease